MADKTVLELLPTDWRSRLWCAVPKAYVTGSSKGNPHSLAIAIAISILSGLRPAELAVGVWLRADEQNKTVTIYINGAKHDKVDTTFGQGKADRGHEWRAVTVNCDSPWADFLYDVLQGQREELRDQWVSFKYNDSTYRNSLTAIGLRIFGIAGLCPYCFRHALAQDLKTSDLVTATEAANLLGHVSTATLWRYGNGRRGRHHNRPFLSVRVPQLRINASTLLKMA